MGDHVVKWKLLNANDTPGEEVEVVMDDEGHASYCALRDRVFDSAERKWLLDGDERVAVLRCIDAVVSTYLLGSRICSPSERSELLGEGMSSLEALAEIEKAEALYPQFRIPQSVKEEIMREGGQTTLIPPSGTTALPYPRSDEGGTNEQSHAV